MNSATEKENSMYSVMNMRSREATGRGSDARSDIGSETIIVSCLRPTYVSVATLTHVTVMGHVSMSEYWPLIGQLMASDWSLIASQGIV